MDSQGYVKNWRSIEDWKYYKVPGYAHLWQHILRKAQHTERYNKYGQLIKRGQLDTGRQQLSKETGVHRSKVDRILEKLEIEHQIEQQKTNRNRIITIVNYERYQSVEHLGEHLVSIQRASSEHPVSTLRKNGKNEKNEKNIVSTELDKSSTRGVVSELDGDCDIEKFLSSVTYTAQRLWLKSYPNDWVKSEILKAISWIEVNPRKRPKNNARFLGSWFARGWEQYHKRIPSQKLVSGQTKHPADESDKFEDCDVCRNTGIVSRKIEGTDYNSQCRCARGKKYYSGLPMVDL